MMPFRGNPRAGAPDAALLKFLFDRQDGRAAAARQNRLDQAAAIAAAKVERRTEANFNFDRAIRLMEFNDKRKSFLTEQSDRVQVAGAQTQQDIAAQPQENFRAEAANPTGALEGLPQFAGQPDFAQIVAQTGPSAFNATPGQRQAITDRNFGPIRRDVGRAADLQSRAFGGDPRSIRGELSDAIDLQGGVDELRRDRELDKTLATEERQETNLAKRGIRKTLAVNNAIRRRTVTLDGANLSPKARAKAEEDRTSLVAERERIFSGGNFAERLAVQKFRVDAREEVRLRAAGVNSIREIGRLAAANPNVSGTPGAIGNLFSNLLGVGTGFSQFVLNDISRVVSRGDVPEWVTGVFFDGIDPDTNAAIEEVRLREYQAAWSIMASTRTGGRPTAKEFERVRKFTDLTGIFVSPERSRNRLKALEKISIESLTRKLKRLQDIDGEVEFDPDTLQFSDETNQDFGLRPQVGETLNQIPPDAFAPSPGPVARGVGGGSSSSNRPVADGISRRLGLQ